MPARQERQVAEPVVLANVPVAHGVEAMLPMAQYDPSGHSAHPASADTPTALL